MNRKITILLCALFFLIVAGGSQAVERVIISSDDARVRPDIPGENYATSQFVYSGYVVYFPADYGWPAIASRSFFRFDLPSAAEIDPTWINSVTLRLFSREKGCILGSPPTPPPCPFGEGFTITLNRITTDWSEGALSWAAQPTFNPVATVTKILTSDDGSSEASYHDEDNVWIEFDVTSEVIANDYPRGFSSWTVRNTAATYLTYVEFATRDTSSSDTRKPQLVIDFTPPPGCFESNPKLEYSPIVERGNRGDTINYTITITNTNTAVCDNSNIRLRRLAGSGWCPNGWTCPVLDELIVIPSGNSVTRNQSIKSSINPSQSIVGQDYTIVARATNETNAGWSYDQKAAIYHINCTSGCDISNERYCYNGYWDDDDMVPESLYCTSCTVVGSSHCEDNKQNCDETAVDCGGINCGACGVEDCAVAGDEDADGDFDCVDSDCYGFCDAANRRYCDAGTWRVGDTAGDYYCVNCITEHCLDTTQNCDETGMNCGGGDCAACGAFCGDGNCDFGECAYCGADCEVGDCCPNGTCDAAIGENAGNCVADCGAGSTCNSDDGCLLGCADGDPDCTCAEQGGTICPSGCDAGTDIDSSDMPVGQCCEAPGDCPAPPACADPCQTCTVDADCCPGLKCEDGKCRGCPPGALICNPLKVCSFAELTDDVIGFIFYLAIFIAPLMILIAGFLFVTAVGSPGRIETAKRIIMYTAIGFGIILLARALVALIESILT